MRRFVNSLGFAFLMSLVLSGVTVAAFALLQPTGEDVGNSQIVDAFKIAGWVTGPVVGLLSFIVISILNVLRRIFRLRMNAVFGPVVIFLGIVPWLIFSWVILDEPRYTAFARAVIDFVGRPMLWGSLVACILTVLFAIPVLIPSKKK